MRRAALALVAVAGCRAAEPRDPALQALLGLRFGVPQGSTQTELVAALAPAGASVECSGDISSTELGVFQRGCGGTIPIAGCPTPVSAGFVRNAMGDGIPHLMYVRLDAPELGDCGPRVEPPPAPWASTLVAQLERELGRAAATGAELRWTSARHTVVVHDARRAPCNGPWRCRSYVELAAPTADSPARGASR